MINYLFYRILGACNMLCESVHSVVSSSAFRFSDYTVIHANGVPNADAFLFSLVWAGIDVGRQRIESATVFGILIRALIGRPRKTVASRPYSYI